MNTIKNLAKRPLRVPLPRGRTLHLGLAKTGQVSDEALAHPPLKKLIDGGEIEVVGHGAGGGGGTAEGGTAPHPSTHGHVPGGGAAPRRGQRGA